MVFLVVKNTLHGNNCIRWYLEIQRYRHKLFLINFSFPGTSYEIL